MLLAALAAGAQAQTSGLWTDHRAASFASFSADEKTITIASAEELALLAYSIYTDGSYRDYSITLGRDLDLSGHGWIPIGVAQTGYDFIGTFDGARHTISNLDVWVKQQKDDEQDAADDVTPNGNVAGLFGQIGTGGIVKDVIISSGPYIGINNPTAACSVGGIAGINKGTIVGCANAARVTGNYPLARVGGIAGENTGTIQNSYNLGVVFTSETDNHVGGVAGDNKGLVQNCFTRCLITAGGDTPSQTVTAYPLVGNNDGTLSACFYMDGSTGNPLTPAIRAFADDGRNEQAVIDAAATGTPQNILLQGRTIYSDRAWNTVCLPFSIPAGATGYSPLAGATVKELDAAASGFDPSTGVLTLSFTDAGTIQAGRPYIVRWDNAIDQNLSDPVFMGVTVQQTTAAQRAVTTADGKVTFQGIFDALTVAGEDRSRLYLGADNTLYYPDASMTIGAFRAYFQLNEGLTAGDAVSGGAIKAFALHLDGTETAVRLPAAAAERAAGAPWYDLSGRQVVCEAPHAAPRSALPKGLYIRRGKKIVVK